MLLDSISYIDYPEIRIDEHETTEMPFRYVKDPAGNPIMPAVGFPSCCSTERREMFDEERSLKLTVIVGHA